MRLFAIRKERGELVILSAENESDAVKRAGMDMETVNSVVQQLRNVTGPIVDAETVIRGGIGPQAYEIRELPSIYIELKLTDTGNVELSDLPLEGTELIDEIYPIIADAADRAVKNWPDGHILDDEGRQAFRQLMVQATEQERVRFAATLDPDYYTI